MNLEERVRKLERSARRWRSGFWLLALISLLSVYLGADARRARLASDDVTLQNTVFERVICRDLAVVDEKDNPLVTISKNTRGDGVIGVQCAASTSPHILMYATADGGNITVQGDQRVNTVSLFSNQKSACLALSVLQSPLIAIGAGSHDGKVISQIEVMDLAGHGFGFGPDGPQPLAAKLPPASSTREK